MGNPAGVKRNFDELEKRRLKAAALLSQGLTQSEVARRVGVHRESVSRWEEQLESGGRGALKKAGRAGRKPMLSETDLRRVEQGLKRGPEALGYEAGLWTAKRVAKLIEHECGVRYTAGHLWRILGALGWSSQRPANRALHRDQKAIRRSRRRRWTDLNKTLQTKFKRSAFSL